MVRTLIALLTAAVVATAATDQSSYELPPISYSKTAPRDRVAELQSKIAAGRAALSFDGDHGYLKSFLDELNVPLSSQSLVFSKTSFQRQRISPRAPRAIYFNDDVYVGWVAGGEVIEVASVDPQLGAVFYTLSQKPAAAPQFVRQTDNCLQCHDSQSLTLGVPGHTVRSVYPAGDGMPHFNRGTFRTTYQSPISERWGGWYVTGECGSMRHLGNAVYPDDPDADTKRITERGANVKDLSSRVEIDSYLAPTSDIVALMVLEHQTYLHNLITRANHQTRVALVQAEEINKLSGSPPGTMTDGTRSRIRANCEPLVEALLFSGEAPLTDRVRGNSSFASDFEKRGPADRKGRSLRQFDLRTRMFRYPCSYLVYSKAFAGLPAAAREYVSGRFREILLGRDTGKAFCHLTHEDRAAVVEILRETLPDFAGAWK